MSKRAPVRIVLVAAVIAALIGGGIAAFDWWTQVRFVQSTSDAYLQADQVTVSSRVAGFVDQVLVADNQSVHAGQPLVKLDEREPRARLEQALAQVEMGRAGIAQAVAQLRQQDAQIVQAQAQLESARSQERFAERQVARYAPLAAAGAETGERYDQIRQNREQAHAQAAQSAAAALSAERQIETLQAQIRQGQAQIERAQAQARQAQVDLDATLVRASIDGRIGDKTVRVGEYVQPGTRLMSVMPVAELYLVANFKETQIGLMRAGQAAVVRIDALDGWKFHGTVESFAPGTGAQFALIPPSNATGNFIKIVQRVPVRIRINLGPEVGKILVPGLSATVAVDTGSSGDADMGEQEGGSAAERPAVQAAASAAPGTAP